MPAASNTKFYGWIAVCGAIIANTAFGGCVLYSLGVFLPNMCTDLSASRSSLSLSFTIFGIMMGLSGPAVGLAITRFGARKSMVLGNLVVGICLICMYFITEIWHIYILFFIGIGCGFGAFIPNTTIASNWFRKKRTLAISLVTSAAGLGGFVFPMLISWLISSTGWRWSWVVIGFTYLILASLIPAILVRNKPEDLGQVPDGIAGNQSDEGTKTGALSAHITEVEWATRDAVRTRAFWMIIVFTTISSFILTIMSTHEVAYLQDIGFPAMIAASGLSIMMMISIPGKLLFGALGIKFESRYLGIAGMISWIIGVTLLINANTVPIMYISSIFNGIGYGGNAVLFPIFVSSYFGRKNYQQIIGWMQPVTLVISTTGSVVAGYIYDVTSSYLWAFLIALFLLTIGIISAVLATPPKVKQ